jgi:hypothetical protein
MDDYQALETMYAVRPVMANDAMNFLTVMSAYLIVAYPVGARLSRFQACSKESNQNY